MVQQSPLVPCPMCGTENAVDADKCTVCGYAYEPARNNEGGFKCARCGSQIPTGYAFCPVCGLDQRQRLARPPTHAVQLGSDGEPIEREPPREPAAAYAEPPPHHEPAAFPEPHRGLAATPPEPPPHPAAVPSYIVAVPGHGVLPQVQPFDAYAPASPTPSQTGRTVFVDGPPLPRPPRVNDDDRTIPVPGKLRRRDEAGPSAAQAVIPPVVASMPAVAAPPVGASLGPPSRLPTRPGLQPRLVLVGRDGEEGESFPLHGPGLAIGRTQGDVLFQDDPFMSPTHARLERTGEAFTLVDLGSMNGVFLRIRGTSPVYPGDLFMVGHQVLRLENVVETVQERAPAPDGTRVFGTPLKPAWGKLMLVGRGQVAGDTYFLRGAKVVFGREQGDILFPQDPFVSREHARLRLELQGTQMSVFLEDLGSANGTYIRIRGSAEVRARDTFRIGDQILRLRLDS